MPDTPTLTLVLLVGLAIGVVLTLLMDSAFLGKRIQEEKNEVLRLENRVNLAEAQVRHLRDDLQDAAGWREQASHFLEDNEELEQKVATAESQIRHLDAQVKGTLLRLTETQNLHKRLAIAETEAHKLRAQLTEAKNQLLFMRLEGKQNLTLVRGIGPAYARRLQEGGIKTLADLAIAEPTTIRQIVQLKEWQNAEPDEWIREAKELSAVFNDEEE